VSPNIPANLDNVNDALVYHRLSAMLVMLWLMLCRRTNEELLAALTLRLLTDGVLFKFSKR
jgi:hypothetical protein